MEKKENILVIGSGGREHAIIKKLLQSKKVTKIYSYPANAGILQDATLADGIDLKDFSTIVHFCKKNTVRYVVVGSEAFLMEGIVDVLEASSIKVFGPKKAGALIEGSKQFMKDIAQKYNIPTAKYKNFSSEKQATEYAKSHPLPIVIKADGLAGGKGVVIALTHKEALSTIKDFFNGKFGEASQKIVIEEFLDGAEASFFAIANEKQVLFLATAEDYKRANDDDKGPNTGGMGSFSPSTIIDKVQKDKIMNRIITPLFNAFSQEKIEYKGIIFAGIMLVKGEPFLIEINCRFGDPETQVFLPLIKNDFFDLIEFVCDKKPLKLSYSSKKAMCVVYAAKGYPENYKTNTEIKNLETIRADGLDILHAGTKKESGKIFAIGGRVLNVVAVASSYAKARKIIYNNISQIVWPNGFYRKDIGLKAKDRGWFF
jgi:phosphoribosylamine--glycine ligase